MLNYSRAAENVNINESFEGITKCFFPECSKRVTYGKRLCYSCSHKICRYEERLDRWLAIFHSDLALEDVMGWYCKCILPKCVRDCLDVDFYYQGCECCPCNRQLGYISQRINNQMYPDEEWIRELRIKINDF